MTDVYTSNVPLRLELRWFCLAQLEQSWELSRENGEAKTIKTQFGQGCNPAQRALQLETPPGRKVAL